MLINPIFTVNNNNNSKCIYPYLSPTFKMKMSELQGIDRFVAKKYKINPQPIKTLEAFQEKCKEMVEKIVGKDFLGRQQETIVQRKEMLKEWFDYVVKENDAYTGAIGLMILAGITKELKPDEDTLPPVLNKGVLADTLTKIQNEISNLKPNEEAQINFEKEYRLNLQKGILKEEKTLDESLNGWIIIPSKEHDPKNFEANVDKLKTLSHNNWCTKSFNAEPYLANGDFHVYMEKGKPKLGVRFIGNKIQEIQGEKNNSRIPFKYEDIVKEHIKSYKLTENANDELKELEKTKAKIERIKSMFPDGINNAPAQKILEALGIKCKQDSDCLLIISHYGDNSLDYSYSDLGIDENRLFEYIKEIEGYAKFSNSNVTNLGNLQTIGGKAVFVNSQITNLGNLQTIGEDAYFNYSKITSLGNLQIIGGNAYFENSQITSLGKLQSIGGNAWFGGSQIISLGNLQSIGGWADFKYSQVTSLGILQKIGGFADFSNSQITSLGNLQSIGGWADFKYSKITSLGNLQSIGGDAYFSNSQITSLGKLQSIGGWADFRNSQLTSLGSLQSIGGWADYRNSQITNLGNLQSIGGNAVFENSQVTSLGNLQSIGGFADFSNSQITSLGNLQSIGGWADFRDSQITSLESLQSIDGNVYINNSPLTEKDFDSIEVGGEIKS